MDFNSTIDLIIRELEEACEILDDIRKSHHAPVLEIELVKSKCRNVSGVISLLKQMEKSGSKEQPVEELMNNPEDQWKKKTIHEEKPHEIIIEKQYRTGTITGPDTKVKTEGPFPEPERIEPENEEPEKPFVAPIIADTFSHLARFNEQLGENQEYSHGKTVTKLSDAIGINDRFYYIKELFHGNSHEYDNVISKLENAANIDEVKTILTKYSSGNRDSEALKNLIDLVKRKFSG